MRKTYSLNSISHFLFFIPFNFIYSTAPILYLLPQFLSIFVSILALNLHLGKLKAKSVSVKDEKRKNVSVFYLSRSVDLCCCWCEWDKMSYSLLDLSFLHESFMQFGFCEKCQRRNNKPRRILIWIYLFALVFFVDLVTKKLRVIKSLRMCKHTTLTAYDLNRRNVKKPSGQLNESLEASIFFFVFSRWLNSKLNPVHDLVHLDFILGFAARRSWLWPNDHPAKLY